MSHRAKTLFHCFSSGINLFITWPLITMHFFWDEFVMSDAFQSCASLVIFGANCSQNSWPFYCLCLFPSTGIKPGLWDGRSLFCALIFYHRSMSRSWRWNGLCLIILFTFQVVDSLVIMSEFHWPTTPKLRRYVFTSNLHSSPWEQGYQARTKSRMLDVNFISNRALVVSHPSFFEHEKGTLFRPLQVERSAIIITRAWKCLSRWKNREIVVSVWVFLVEQPIYIFIFLVKANGRN
jgi:hypothetical protein